MLEQKEMGSPRAPEKINAIELPENLKNFPFACAGGCTYSISTLNTEGKPSLPVV